jgi:hypothetical protein
MRSTIVSLLIITAAGMICGCSSVLVTHSEPDRASIEAKYSKLDLSRGVSREDAVVIAQHYMLFRGYDYDWYIAAPEKVSEDSVQKSWTLEFQPKANGWGGGPRPSSEVTFQMLLPYRVIISKDTGEISVVTIRTKEK